MLRATVLVVSTNSVGYASMHGPVPRTTPRFAPLEPKPRIRGSGVRGGRYAPIGRNRYTHATSSTHTEVLQRFRVAPTTRLVSDAEEFLGEVADVSLLEKRLRVLRRSFVPLRSLRSLM